MYETVYTEHLKGRKVLLETPTGFAVFIVNDFAFEQDKNIWVHFSDPECAIQALFALGFKKLNKSAARNDDASPAGEDLVQLIKKFCKTGETLIVQDKELKASIEKKIVDKPFISKFGFLCYLDMNLEGFPKELSRSFDKYVGIGDTIKDGLDYVKVLALVLVPELVEEHGLSKTFSSDLQSKFEEARRFQVRRNDDLTMHDVEKIMGYLEYLLHGCQQRHNIIMDVKLMEAALHRSIDGVQRVNPWEPVDFNKMEYRRVLVETPSGFAMFNVWEYVFCNPEDIWTCFADIHDARKLVFGIGFVRVDDRSVTRDSVNGPGDELRQLILRFCDAKTELVVQDTQLKAVIETKLGVECWTGDQVVEEVIWGLKYVMRHFILQESNKITDSYFRPLSKQLLKDLKTYGIHVSTSDITDIIKVFGYVKFLDVILKETSKALHAKCNCYVSDIIISEDDVTNANMIAKVAKVLVPEFKEEIVVPQFKDDVTNANMIAKVAKVLVPEFKEEIVVPQFKEEIGLPEIAGGLGSKTMYLPKGAVKAIADCDKQEILKFLETLSKICREKKRAFQELREIEAQIGVARIAVSDEALGKGDEAVGKHDEAVGKDDEAVGKDDEGKTHTKGSNKDGGSGKKC